MSILSRLGAQARYNVLTPVFLLSLGLAAPALADNQDWVITTPETNFLMLENDALTNHSLITGTGGNPAIHGEGNVRFVNNTVAGQISSNGDGIYIVGSAGQIINAGSIATASEAIEVDGDVGSFINSGDILSVNDEAIHVDGNVQTFRNSGIVSSSAETAVYLDGNVGSFTNTGTLGAVGTGVLIDDHVGSFLNSGVIESLDVTGVQLGSVDYFLNEGTIAAETYGIYIGNNAGQFINRGNIVSEDGVAIELENIGTFENSGTIIGEFDGVHINGGVSSFNNSGSVSSNDDEGVSVALTTGSFENSGTISGDSQGVELMGNVGTFNNLDDAVISGDQGVLFGAQVEGFFNGGTISAIHEAVISVGFVGQFANSGRIISQSGFGVTFQGDVGQIHNSGTIQGYSGGILAQTVGFLTNSGAILSQNGRAVLIEDGIGVLANSGLIRSVNDQAISIDKDVNTFINHATGAIISNGTLSTAVTIGGDAKTMINAGSIAGYNAVAVQGNVEHFENRASGFIAAADTAVFIGGNVATFANHGRIYSSAVSGIYIQGTAGSVANTGEVSGSEGGFYFDDDVASFLNSGTIRSADDRAVYFDGDVEHVVNLGLMEADDIGLTINGDALSILNGAQGEIIGGFSGVKVFGEAASFINHGKISALTADGVSIDGEVGSVINTGQVSSAGLGFRFGSDISSFENAGYIDSGGTGVYFEDSVTAMANFGVIVGDVGVYIGEGGAYLRNSGAIVGTNGNSLIFNGDNNILDIRSGARFVGDVDFGSGANTYLDASAYHGSIVIGDDGATLYAGNVRAGTNYSYQTPDFIYIVSDDFVRRSALPVASLAGGVADVLARQLALGDAVSNPNDLAMNYAAKPRSAAETATLSAMETGEDRLHVWGEALGGFGGDRASETAEGYAALVAGAHREVANGLTLGAFAGTGHTRLDVANGAHVIAGAVALAGVYGKYDAGIVRTDFSLVAGLSGNDSTRETVNDEEPLVNTASYGGWFIAPSAGAYVPVLRTENGEIAVGGRLGYLAGGFAGYTEAGSMAGLAVDAQSFGILTALLEVRGETTVQDGLTLNGSAGVFARNHSGSDVEVFFPLADDTMGISSASTGAGLGVKAALGAEMVVSDALTLTAGVNASWASNSGAVAAANIGLGGKF